MAENEETIEENDSDEEVRKAGALLSPEGFVMMGTAITLDFIGLILTILNLVGAGVPEIINWMSDGAGLMFFGLWTSFRAPFYSDTTGAEELAEGAVGRRVEMTKTLNEKRPEIERLKREMEKPMKQEITRVPKTVRKMGRGLRFGVAILGEVVPFVGALPFWTWFVYSELRR